MGLPSGLFPEALLFKAKEFGELVLHQLCHIISQISQGSCDSLEDVRNSLKSVQKWIETAANIKKL